MSDLVALLFKRIGGLVLEDSRVRNFAFILYPESAPQNWLSILEDLLVPCFVSPLHDKDIIIETGEPKKPHYHVFLMFSGKKSYNQVIGLLSPLNIQYVDQVNDARAYARYLCHLDFFDRSDKRLYDPNKVIQLNGADYQDIVHSPSDDTVYSKEIMNFIWDHDVDSFAELCRYCQFNEPEWFYILLNKKTSFFKSLLSSRYNSKHPKE